MIDATNIVTYKTERYITLGLTWVAYVRLPNGDYWGVRFHGATEEEAVTRALSRYNAEFAKFKAQGEHHLVNMIWMRHKETRDLKRVHLTEITMYEKNGYERSGPRAK